MQSLNVGGRLLDLSTPIVMGILNVTPDSFYDGGQYNDIKTAIEHIKLMILEGASIIDIGAASSRPTAIELSAEDELKRLEPIINEVIIQFPDTILSIDTYHAKVVDTLSRKSAFIINDISGGQKDPDIMKTVSGLGFPYIMMHMKGMPDSMQDNPTYHDVVQEILVFFVNTIRDAKKVGIDQLIIDPGFGFGKTVEHNYSILSKLDLFQILDLPILAGISRKSMIYKVLEIDAVNALNGTTALHMTALTKGAKILRAHDVKEAKEVIKLWSKLEEQ